MGKVALYVHICTPFARYRRDTGEIQDEVAVLLDVGAVISKLSLVELQRDEGKEERGSLPPLHIHTFCHRQGAARPSQTLNSQSVVGITTYKLATVHCLGASTSTVLHPSLARPVPSFFPFTPFVPPLFSIARYRKILPLAAFVDVETHITSVVSQCYHRHRHRHLYRHRRRYVPGIFIATRPPRRPLTQLNSS